MYWILVVALLAQDGTKSEKRTEKYTEEKNCHIVKDWLKSAPRMMDDKLVIDAKCVLQRTS